MPDRDSEDPESPTDAYQQWLEDLAGGPVKVGWIIMVWLVLSLGVFAMAVALGAADAPAGVIVAVMSALYWFWAVPLWARRRNARRDR
jgi:hypothetical protein